jgi:hypothetical protein
MAEVHTTITGKNNEVNVVFHNPGIAPLPTNAGQAITTVKTSGSTSVQGQVPNSSVVVSNPA